MEDKDRIAILLAEYNTLRAELMAVRTYVIQACSIGMPLFAASTGIFLSLSGWQKYIAGVAALAIIIILIATTVHSDLRIRAFTKQLRELEGMVNGLANQRLLTWETDHGWGSLLPIKKPKP